ncbi:MAG: 3-deoxy-manno-octulosonate cytidylyltransferase [Armatimonadetes bacterium]|nr:3-deoxy-manno-octulosonate cytidylyltransferase [Armatimonadota bacterium]
MKTVALIPARYASTRFPGKPLLDLLGKPMIQWVYERASAAPGIDEVIVATDDERIAAAVRGFRGRVEMTSPEHPTGTDRLAEVAAQLDAEIVVNVQGDEPTLNPACITQAVAPLLEDSALPMSTLRAVLPPEDLPNPNVVKVVVDRNDRALYFSRASIPYLRAGGDPTLAFKHIGLYAYRREFLLQYARLEPTPLERSETLEQLRALEHGYAIAAPLTDWNPISIDTPEDVGLALEWLKIHG